MADTSETVPEWPFPRDMKCPFDPPPGLINLLENSPVSRVRIWSGETAWLVAGYEDNRAVSSDDRVSVNTRRDGFPFALPTIRTLSVGQPLIMALDEPEHGELRRKLLPEFTVRKVNALRPRIQSIVDELINSLIERPTPVDLVRHFALPIPSKVIAEMLGVPYQDHEFFERVSDTMLSNPDESRNASKELHKYLHRLVDSKRESPSDDLLSILVGHWIDGEMTKDEVVGIGHVALVGGHETTANMIALSAAVLFLHPDQAAELRESTDPAIIQNAVEELLRYLHIAQSGRRRIAVDDFKIRDQQVRAGEGIILAGNIADRDPDAFDGDTGALDIGRRARHHLAFGYGIHQCLGQSLARAEVQIAIGTLLRRIPEMKLAVDWSEVPFKDSNLIYGVRALPVKW